MNSPVTGHASCAGKRRCGARLPADAGCPMLCQAKSIGARKVPKQHGEASAPATISCLEEALPSPSCTVSEGWLNCCCTQLQFPVKNSQEAPNNQHTASVFLLNQDHNPNPSLQHLIFHTPFFPTNQPPLFLSALPTPAQNPLCLLLLCSSSALCNRWQQPKNSQLCPDMVSDADVRQMSSLGQK